VFSLFSGY